MNYQDIRRPPPARKADDGPANEQLPGQLSVRRFNQDGAFSQKTRPPPTLFSRSSTTCDSTALQPESAFRNGGQVRKNNPPRGPARRDRRGRRGSPSPRRRDACTT